MFVPSLIKSIQRGTITVTGSASGTATITAVNMNSSRLRLLWNTTTSGANITGAFMIELTNATTVTATCRTDNGQTSVVGFEVTEYMPGVIRSVQRSTITIAALATSNTATITAVNTAKSELEWLGQHSDEATQNADGYSRLELTNATTVTASRQGGGGAAGTTVTSFEVVQWF